MCSCCKDVGGDVKLLTSNWHALFVCAITALHEKRRKEITKLRSAIGKSCCNPEDVQSADEVEIDNCENTGTPVWYFFSPCYLHLGSVVLAGR